MNARMSVVIPAHDEATIIARLLDGLVRGDASNELEIVVVANGCADDTAAVARGVAPGIRVVEIAVASKIAALNAGDAAAAVFPRAYVDADVDIAAEVLLELARRLEAGPALVASPRLDVRLEGASLPVRQYYRVWALSQYRAEGHIGSGVYVLSAEGRGRFGRFPDVIADDRFVQQQFAPGERLAATDLTFTVTAPRRFGALLKRAARIADGNAQLAREYPALAAGQPSVRFGSLLRRVAARPAVWASLPAYAAGYLVARVGARRRLRSGELSGWNRDDTTRVAA
jgi:glycosyltransferase involved in cell wall biosynthesis